MPELAVKNETNQWEQELDRLFREHYPMLYRTAYSLVNNAADAEDVPQTIFVRLLRSGPPRDIHANPAGYLYRAAVNASLSIIRSRKRFADTNDIEGMELQAEHAGDSHQRVVEMIADLHPTEAHILTLRYLHNYSDADIAKMLGTSRVTIAVRLLRLRARLRKMMQKSPGEKP